MKGSPMSDFDFYKMQEIAGTTSEFDYLFHSNSKTKRSDLARHENLWQWLASFANKKEIKILEIGSRAVNSDSLWKIFTPDSSYTGFDYLEGKNVNVIGDAHRLSDYFAPDSFDIVISFAVFEHLAMPWLVAEEIAKVLKLNGLVCVETHFSFSEHELPWHFFHYHPNALEIIFCKELGFETIDSGLDNPIVGRFSNYASPYLKGKLVPDLYCHSSIVTRKTAHCIERNDIFDWRKVLKRLNAESSYPANTMLSGQK